MRKYTEKLHAKRLLGMLEKRNPCGCCPAGKRYMEDTKDWAESVFGEQRSFCKVCWAFISLERLTCPCWALGEQEAIKRTWLALEEKGYI